jgi:hypothetical protein
MTPEEAIAELKEFLESIKQFPNDDTFRCELDRAGVKAILAAIRAAENDALERAAVAADWHNVHAPYGDAKHATPGEHIRALKPEETK